MNDIRTYCFVCNTEHLLFGNCPNQVMPSWTAPPTPLKGDARKQMHPQMATFLDTVWDANRRKAMTSYWDVYDVYNKVVGTPPTITNPSAQKFFQYVADLVKLEQDNECKVSVQGYEAWTFSALAAYAKGVPQAPLPQQLVDKVRAQFQVTKEQFSDAQVSKAFPNDFFETFYHFLPYKREGCTQRVYLNVKGDEAVKVMKFVVPSIMPGLPGCDEAKIAGPRTAGARADTIVIYSKGQTTTNAILQRLTEYQRLSAENRARFEEQTPLMTEKAAGLVGTSVGAEPKVDDLGKRAGKVLSDRESFGSMRSKLVFKAIQTKPKDKDKFFAEVIGMFASARLSPMAPHIN